MSAPVNPFPGAQPYGHADERFRGRTALAKKLFNHVLVRPCTLLYGPSGAGKSSLLQAAVVPRLEALEDDAAYRVASVASWPREVLASTWAAAKVVEIARVEPPAPGQDGAGAFDDAVGRAERRSPRPLLVILDQLEQLLYAGREKEIEELASVLARHARRPRGGLQIVLCLREDYLGRFRHRVRAHRELYEHAFRVGPLGVGELAQAVVEVATEWAPPQPWTYDEMRSLLSGVCEQGQASEQDDAEVDAALGQIVCRRLWAQRAEGIAGPPPEARTIVEGYLEATLADLAANLREPAERLLDALVEGRHRTHLLEATARRAMGEAATAEQAGEVLDLLEKAAVLRVENRRDARYFELGHDWLARRVSEWKEGREAREREKEKADREEAERRRVEGELDRERDRLKAERAEAVAERAKIEKRREENRKLIYRGVLFAAAPLLLAASGLAVSAWLRWKDTTEHLQQATEQRDAAAADRERTAALHRREQNGTRLLGGREQLLKGERSYAALLLADVELDPAEVDVPGSHGRRFEQLGVEVLSLPSPLATLLGHETLVRDAQITPDGHSLITIADKKARLWTDRGSGEPRVVGAHTDQIYALAVSADGLRVATGGADEKVRVWAIAGSAAPLATLDHGAAVESLAFDRSGGRLVSTGGGFLLVWSLQGNGGAPTTIKGARPDIRITNGRLSAAGDRVVGTYSEMADGGDSKSVFRVWAVDDPSRPLHTLPAPAGAWIGAASVASFTEDGSWIVELHREGDPTVWPLGRGAPERTPRSQLPPLWPDQRATPLARGFRGAAMLIPADDGPILTFPHPDLWVHLTYLAPGGQRLVTAGSDKLARVWEVAPPSWPTLRQLTQGWIGAVSIAGGRVLVRDPKDRVVATSLSSLERRITWPDRNILALSADGSHAALAVGAGGVELRTTGADVLVASLPPAPGAKAVLLDRSGRRLARVLSRSIEVWDASRRGSPVRTLSTPADLFRAPSSFWTAVLASDGERLCTLSDDRKIRVWQMSSDAPPIVIGVPSPVGAGSQLALDESGDKLLVLHKGGRSGASARVWNLSQLEDDPVALGEGDGEAGWLSWSPDGRHLLALTNDLGRVYDLEAPSQSIVLRGHDKAIRGGAWRADGKRLLTWSEDRTARVWDADNGDLVWTLRHEERVVAAAFDGESVVTVTAIGALRLWDLSVLTPAWIRDQLRAATHDCLPPELRAYYLVEDEATAKAKHKECLRDRAPHLLAR